MKKTALFVALAASSIVSHAQSQNAYSAHEYTSATSIANGPQVHGTALNVPGIQTFSAAAADHRVKLEWNAVKEESLERYEVERSTDGIGFGEVIATFTAGQGSYEMTDLTATAGRMYYRVRTVAENGISTFSPTREVRVAAQSIQRSVYPTNNRNGLVYILLNPDTEDVTITVVNAAGAAARVSAVREGRQFVANLQSLPAGMYHVIVDAAGARSTHRVMYQP